jgi:hypothetical protein
MRRDSGQLPKLAESVRVYADMIMLGIDRRKLSDRKEITERTKKKFTKLRQNCCKCHPRPFTSTFIKFTTSPHYLKRSGWICCRILMYNSDQQIRGSDSL